MCVLGMGYPYPGDLSEIRFGSTINFKPPLCQVGKPSTAWLDKIISPHSSIPWQLGWHLQPPGRWQPSEHNIGIKVKSSSTSATRLLRDRGKSDQRVPGQPGQSYQSPMKDKVLFPDCKAFSAVLTWPALTPIPDLADSRQTFAQDRNVVPSSGNFAQRKHHCVSFVFR